MNTDEPILEPHCPTCGNSLDSKDDGMWECGVCQDVMCLGMCDDCLGRGDTPRHRGPNVVGRATCETCGGEGWVCPSGHAVAECTCLW